MVGQRYDPVCKLPQIGDDYTCVLDQDGKCSFVIFTTEYCPEFDCGSNKVVDNLKVGSSDNLNTQMEHLNSEDVRFFLEVNLLD